MSTMHNPQTLSMQEKTLLCCFAAIVPGIMLGFSVLVGFALLTFAGLLLSLPFRTIRTTFKTTPIFWAWSIFTILCGLSVINSLDPQNSAESLLFLGLILCFSWIAQIYLNQNVHRLHYAQTVILIIACVMLILAVLHLYVFVGFLRTSLPFRDMPDAIYNTIMLKKPASGFVVLLPLLIYIALVQNGLRRWLAGLVMIGIAWLIIVSESRSAMAAAVAVVGVMALMGIIIQRWKPWAVASIALVFAVIITAIVLYMLHIRGDWLSGPLGLPGWIIDTPRQIIWNEVLLLFKEDFPSSLYSGYGINALEQLERGERVSHFTDSLKMTIPAIFNHPHNWALEVTAEVGAIGLISLCVAIGLMLRWGWSYRYSASSEVMAFVGIFAAFWTASLFNYSIWSVWWQIIFAAMCAICASMIRHSNKGNES